MKEPHKKQARHNGAPKPKQYSKPIAEERVEEDRRVLHLELHVNDKGPYIRLVERSGDHRRNIIVGKGVAKQFHECFGSLVAYMDKI